MEELLTSAKFYNAIQKQSTLGYEKWTGNQQHVVRRRQEVLAASQMLTDLGWQLTMAAASAEWLERQKRA
jgi:hypothetical protein